MDSATPQHTNTAAGGGHAVAEIARALSAESWARKDVGTPKAVFTARTWTSPDGSLQLLLTSGVDGLHADLTGATTSGDGLAPPRLWSLTVTTPSPAQITAVVKAATTPPATGASGLAADLADDDWVSFSTYDHDELVELHTSRPDGKRTVRWLAADDHGPGGWMVTGSGVQADATDGTPPAVIWALATG
jgi:hypothetical protein